MAHLSSWSEYDVIRKSWQLLTVNGEKLIKVDLAGNFLNVATNKKVKVAEVFNQIRNCADSEGFIIAKRKRVGQPLMELKYKKKIKIPC